MSAGSGSGPAVEIAANLMSTDALLIQVIERLDAVRHKLILVVDQEGRLLGTVTDGDVRRGLMRRLSMEASVTEVMNASPLALAVDAIDAVASRLLQEKGVALAPVIDAERRVIGLYPDAPAPAPVRNNLVVIMAGGRGVRLAPLTHTCPKPMLKVGGRPLLETIIERLRAQGFRRFRLAVNYLAEIIEDHFGDGSAFGVEIEYLRETEPLGTAGALSLLHERPTEPFLVMNGDVLTRMSFGDLLDFHQDHALLASVCVREHSFQSPHGVVETDGVFMTAIREKPTFRWHASAGVYCLSPDALAQAPSEGMFDMPDLLAALAIQPGRVGAFPIHEYWLDIGRPPDFEAAQGEAPSAA